MTKTDARFKLTRALSDRDLENIMRVHAVFGMLTTRVSDSGDEVFVIYDASRLSLPEVRGVLQEHGIPIQ
ncbi:MAG: hypothetical protein ACRD45_11275 [Bryobacteraceae bacterium]